MVSEDLTLPLTFVQTVFVFSQEHLVVLDSRKWSISQLELSIVDLFQLFQLSIQNKPLVVIQVLFMTRSDSHCFCFQRRMDCGMTGEPGRLAVRLVDFVARKQELELVHLLHTDVLARELC